MVYGRFNIPYKTEHAYMRKPETVKMSKRLEGGDMGFSPASNNLWPLSRSS